MERDSRNKIGSRNFSRSALRLELRCGDMAGFSSSQRCRLITKKSLVPLSPAAWSQFRNAEVKPVRN